MARKRKRRRWIILIGLALVFIIVANALSRGPGEVAEADPVEVEVGTVVRRLAETGTIQMDRTVEVKSQVAGRIVTLFADVGDRVEEGQLLAVIEPDPNKALQLAGKRASVARAEDSFALAESQLSQQRLELQILEREVRAQASAVKTTPDSLLLEDYEIVSPMRGIVTDRPVEEGELVTSAVASNVGTALFNVGDPEDLIVEIRVAEVDVGEAKVGLEAEIRVDAIPGEVFKGVLRHVAPTGGTGQGSSIVAFDAEVEVVEFDPRLRAGMTADVDLVIGRAEEVPWLPVEAVATIYAKDEEGNETEAIDRRIVYVRTEDGWEERTVETGLESNTRVQILEGLEVGDRVHPDAAARLEQLNATQESTTATDNSAGPGGPRGRRG
jgi:RND family efflux transporter MFP subunit